MMRNSIVMTKPHFPYDTKEVLLGFVWRQDVLLNGNTYTARYNAHTGQFFVDKGSKVTCNG